MEREGLPTTSISLIREHSEILRPPRALWVSFYLGRPLGVPNDPDFQREVLRATLNLLPTATEHTIVDYPIDVPDETFSDNWACPISFEATDADTLTGRLRAEVQSLGPWWQETNRERGRSGVGASGASPDQIESAGALLSTIAEGASLTQMPEVAEGVDWIHPMPYLLRHAAQDLRSYYHEAAASRPGQAVAPSHRALNNWIFEETVFGEALLAVGKRLAESGDPRITLLRGWLIPEGFWPEGRSFGTAPGTPNPLNLADEALTYLASSHEAE